MAGSGIGKAIQESPEVTFSLEMRPATQEQVEAGKRLFSRLMERAQLSIRASHESKEIGTKS